MTTIEGMACGTPGIVYNRTASPELVSQETGIIVEAGNIESLLNAIMTIKSRGKNNYSEDCISRVSRYFDKDTQFSEYIKLYNRLINA